MTFSNISFFISNQRVALANLPEGPKENALQSEHTDKNIRGLTRVPWYPRFLLVSVTPYSINSLFGEFFGKFGGVFLEVFETMKGHIWEAFWKVFRRF